MVQTLDAAQQRLVRGFGTWQIAQIVCWPEERQPQGWPWIGGGSWNARYPGKPGDWLEYDTKGMRILTGVGAKDVVVNVSWGAIRMHVRRLGPDLVEQVQATVRALLLHREGHVPFVPPKGTSVMDHPVKIGPVTKAQHDYRVAYEEWFTDLEEMYRLEAEDLYDQLEAQIAACFPGGDNLCRCTGFPHPPSENCVAA